MEASMHCGYFYAVEFEVPESPTPLTTHVLTQNLEMVIQLVKDKWPTADVTSIRRLSGRNPQLLINRI